MRPICALCKHFNPRVNPPSCASPLRAEHFGDNYGLMTFFDGFNPWVFGCDVWQSRPNAKQDYVMRRMLGEKMMGENEMDAEEDLVVAQRHSTHDFISTREAWDVGVKYTWHPEKVVIVIDEDGTETKINGQKRTNND